MKNRILQFYPGPFRTFVVVINCELHATFGVYVKGISKQDVELRVHEVFEQLHPDLILSPAPELPVEVTRLPELTELDLILIDEATNDLKGADLDANFGSTKHQTAKEMLDEAELLLGVEGESSRKAIWSYIVDAGMRMLRELTIHGEETPLYNRDKIHNVLLAITADWLDEDLSRLEKIKRAGQQ